ncbi:MAG: hypothetical protein SPJ30_00335, partial [Faecalibacterium sp.]|nr:hypothetical protein [Faecalibacterium sp.]
RVPRRGMDDHAAGLVDHDHVRILQSQVDEYNKLNPEYPILFTAAWATSSEDNIYDVRELVRTAQKKMSLIAEENIPVFTPAATERGGA